MEPQPQVTPYDILEIPYVPWSPGPGTWGLFVIAVIVVVLLVVLLRKVVPFFENPTQKAFRYAKKELDTLYTSHRGELNKLTIARALTVAKRLLEALGYGAAAQMTASELSALASSTSSGAARALISDVLYLEQQRYAAPQDIATIERAKLKELRERVHALEQEVQT